MTISLRWPTVAAALILSIGPADAQTSYLISTYAGGLPAPTAAPATTYAFESANGVATDRFGNTYISSSLHCVFRLDAAGNLSRVAGTCQGGFSGDGGSAVNAQLNNPQGVALDALGNLYIADQANQRVRQVTPAGTITTVAGTGTAGYFGDSGPATGAQLNYPQGVAVDSAGNLYIADSANCRIRQLAPDGTITTVAGTGNSGSSGDGGPAANAAFSYPSGLALDAAGNLYVADSRANQVRKFNPGGAIVHVAGTGSPQYSGDSGPAVSAALSYPQGMAVDSAGNLYVADNGNYAVRRIDVRGIVTTYAGGNGFGNSGDRGQAARAQLAGPAGVAMDSSGDLYVADLAGMVRMVDGSGTITTVAGAASLPFSGDGGAAALAQLAAPWGLALDGLGNLFVADWSNNRVRKVDSAGTISTFAGNGVEIDAGDGGQAVDASVTPYTVAVDSKRNVYLADSGIVRKIDSNGAISTLTGTGFAGYNGDNQPATAAQVSSYLPGLAVDSHGNVFISDWVNQRVREVVAATGYIVTVAGTGSSGYSGDGNPATAYQVNNPAGLAVDTNGNLYIADSGNCRVRKLSTDGVISTVAGDGTCASTGDGQAASTAEITAPWAVAVDGSGNLYIATQGNTIRKVSTGGAIGTVAGTGVAGYSGDGGPATSAQLNYPIGLAVDSAGNVYISDSANGAVRVLQPQAEPLLSVSSSHSGVFAAGQAGGEFTITVSNGPQAGSTSGTVTVTDVLPPSLTPVNMGGPGWTCSYASPPYFCTNTGSLAGSDSFEPIALAVSVASGAPPQVTNLVTVSGGGSAGNSSFDAVFIGAPAPTLEIAATHAGGFMAGQQATFTINVANQVSAPPTSGQVTVIDTPPAGFSQLSLTGAGWNCTGATCTNNAPLAGGASYSPIAGTVTVSSNALSPEINQAAVSGGGSASANSSDTIAIVSGACLVTGGTAAGVADVQALINQALGASAPANDVNQDGAVNIVDVQIAIGAALSLGCVV